MLEDDVQATTQQVLVAGQAARNDTTRNFKSSSQQGPSNRGQLPDFRWPGPIRSNPMERDRSKKCAYRKVHGHTTEACRSHHLLVNDLLKEGHLKHYVRVTAKSGESSRDHGPRAPTAPVRAVIDYIHGGPLDEEYSSRKKRQRLLRAATVQEHKNSIRSGLASGSIHLRILVDPGSSTDLLQVSVIKQMGFIPSSLENPGRILFGFNGASTTSLGDIILPIQAGPVILNVIFFRG
ncbi:hypothetical protein CK203_026480 [Vitis vinifera]|uniref:Retrotransposon gag domain-containing protein n=1 Tax=Vitis vinifera TaxID=29760 RepID=A0A438IVU3_VITVI|nr:hypothetical protein CK203_026480 [Vitis vinifera]